MDKQTAVYSYNGYLYTWQYWEWISNSHIYTYINMDESQVTKEDEEHDTIYIKF